MLIEVFAVSGWHNKKVNSYDSAVERAKSLNNIHMLGYITDEEMKCLISNCKAFLFPSTYEGFGLPPLEALACGAKVFVSDIPVMHEVFKNSVIYIDDNNTKLFTEESINPEWALSNHSWIKAAEMMLFHLNENIAK